MPNKIFASILSLLLAGLPALARQTPATTAPAAPRAPQQQEETVRVGAAAVQVDVVVTDKAGRHITGLTAGDFQVLDEGKPQPLDYFAVIEGSRLSRSEARGAAGADTSTAARAEANAPALARPYPGRHLALLIDDPSMSNDTFIRSRKALAEYVNKLTPNDMAAIISMGGRLGSLQQFTNDKQRLLSAIDRVAAQSNRTQTQNDARFQMTPAEAVRIDQGDRDVLDAVARRASTQSIANQNTTGSLAAEISRTSGDDPNDLKGGEGGADPVKNQLRTIARGRVGDLAAQSRNTIQTLRNLFKSMAELPGRKIVVLLSESFITLGGTTEDQSTQLQQLIDLGRRSGISVYALDPAGLRTNSAQASEQLTGVGLRAQELSGGRTSFTDFENMSAARYVATGTGGNLIANTNDIVAGLDRAVEDASSYYVIGFRPPALDNKFHRLTVTIKGKPDLVVRTRRGYLAVNQETVAGTNTELAAALLSPIPRTDLPLEVVANVLPKPGSQVVSTGFHVNRNYLALPPAGADRKAVYDIVAWLFAIGQEKPVDVVARTLTYDLNVPDELQKLKTEGFLLLVQHPALAPGQYQIRAVVRERTSGQVGSAYQFFEVPDATNRKAISLSTILLGETGQVGFKGAYSFKRNAEVDARWVAYNLPKEAGDLTQRVRLLDADGRTLLDSALPLSTAADPAAPNLAQQGTRLKVPPARGHYALVVNLQDKKARVDVERRADFIVE